MPQEKNKRWHYIYDFIDDERHWAKAFTFFVDKTMRDSEKVVVGLWIYFYIYSFPSLPIQFLKIKFGGKSI